MPYPNEHACRIADPDKVRVVGSIDKNVDGKKIRILVGKRAGQTTSETQAIRYPTSDWTAAEARAHCREHKGISFEAASGKDQEFMDPLDNDFIKTGPED